MYQVQDKVVLITGASSGIGKATAIYFANHGAKIVINYNNNKAGAKETQEIIEKEGGVAIIIQGDISNSKLVDEMYNKVINEFGTIDILINNAGILGPYGEYESLDLEEIKKVFSVNIVGPMYCSQKFITVCKEQEKKGIILNNSSVYGNYERGGDGGLVAYHATKASLTNFTGILAKSVSPDIRVNAVAPAVVLTPIQDKYSEKVKRSFSERTLIKRRISPQEVAHAFMFLAQNEAITGQTIYIDGGFMMNG